MEGRRKEVSDVISVRGLEKRFGDIKAVDGLSFSVKKGSLFAFLGENGAGKSTTISILCGVLKKDGGEVKIDGISAGENAARVKEKIGVVFQGSVLDAPLTVRQNLESRAALYGITGKAWQDRLGQLSELLELSDLLDRPVGKLSGGQRRRADIARALLHQPEILILDEPTTGLDPQTRLMLWHVIASLQKEQGLTVFLTTHYMEEAADADYVVILEKGKVSAEGTPLELKNRYACDSVLLYGVSDGEAQALGLPFERIPDGIRIRVKHTEEATRLILAHPELFRDYEITKGRMDDVFLAVTGKSLKGGE
ncbi:MAG: ABC transporter ATP-binding protein [Clostridia bacterium]|nr:ABC transporter ATP-binding protein [Clostridia bacterium]